MSFSDLTHLRAYGQLTIAQIAIAVNVIVGKVLIEKMPTALFLCGRFLISFILLSGLFVLLRAKLFTPTHPTQKLTSKDWLILTAQALTGGFLFNYLFYWGVEHTTATSAAIIASTLPAMIAICAFLALGERLGAYKIIGIILAILGIAVVTIDNPHAGDKITGSFFGDLIVLLSIIPEAMYSIFSKYSVKRLTPLGAAVLINLLIFLMFVPFALPATLSSGVIGYGILNWVLVAIGGAASLFFFWSWSAGLLIVPASTAAIFGGVLPVATTFLAWVFLGEVLGMYDVLGMFMVFIALIIACKN